MIIDLINLNHLQTSLFEYEYEYEYMNQQPQTINYYVCILHFSTNELLPLHAHILSITLSDNKLLSYYSYYYICICISHFACLVWFDMIIQQFVCAFRAAILFDNSSQFNSFALSAQWNAFAKYARRL